MLRRRRATCTAATSRRSTASPTSLLRERPVEAGIDPLFEVARRARRHASTFDAAYERFQDELLVRAAARSSSRALRRGFGLDELREACELLNQHRYLRPLDIPTHEDGELATHLAEFRADRRRAAGAAASAATPATTPARADRRGDHRVGRRSSQALGTEAEQEFELLYRPRADTHLSGGSKANWGEGKEQLKALQQEYRDAHDAAKDGLRTDALLGLLPRIEQFVDDYERQRRKQRGEPDFDDLLFWARDLLRDEQAGARLLPPPLQGRADRRVPGHRPRPGRARAAPDQRPGARTATGGRCARRRAG